MITAPDAHSWGAGGIHMGRTGQSEHQRKGPQGASHGGSEKPWKLEVGGASRDSTGLGALEEGLISS